MATNIFLSKRPKDENNDVIGSIQNALVRNDLKCAISLLHTPNIHHTINDTINDDKPGWTLLHDACFNGLDAFSEALILHGACINSIDITGSTPLHDAVRNGYIKCVKILCDNGADTTIKTSTGETAFDIAMEFPETYKSKNELANCLKKAEDINAFSSQQKITIGKLKEENSSLKKQVADQNIQLREMRNGNAKRDNHFQELIHDIHRQLKVITDRLFSNTQHTHRLPDNERTTSEHQALQMRQKVKENLVMLQKNLSVDDIMVYMFSKSHLDENDIQTIESEHCDNKKVFIMIRLLLKKNDPFWVYDFKESLIMNEHSQYLVQTLWGNT